MDTPAVVLDGRGVAIADVVAVARGRAQVSLGDEARTRVIAARAVVDSLAQSGTAVYGVNSALGANTGRKPFSA